MRWIKLAFMSQEFTTDQCKKHFFFVYQFDKSRDTEAQYYSENIIIRLNGDASKREIENQVDPIISQSPSQASVQSLFIVHHYVGWLFGGVVVSQPVSQFSLVKSNQVTSQHEIILSTFTTKSKKYSSVKTNYMLDSTIYVTSKRFTDVRFLICMRFACCVLIQQSNNQ